MTKAPTDLDQSQALVGDHGWEVVNSSASPLKRISINGCELTYTEKGKGESVILVHGALGDYRTWSRQLHSLSGEFQVFAYSRRYHQPLEARPAVTDYTYRTHAHDLIRLIETLRSEPVHLIGHSYGGAVAALAALERPDLVNSLILTEPFLFSILSKPNDKVSCSLHRIALNVVKKLTEMEEQSLAVREYVKIVMDKDAFDDLPVEAQGIMMQNAETLGPMLSTCFDPLVFDLHRARNLQTPTLLISGEFSPTVYRAICQKLHSVLPNSEIFTIPAVSYGLPLENPIVFDRTVLEFLSRNKKAAT